MYNMQYFLLSFPCFLVHILPHFVAQIVTCSVSYGLWPHAVRLNEQNKYHLSYHITGNTGVMWIITMGGWQNQT
jgi:hypothetical protein